MITKSDVLESILHECDICSHLFTKLPSGGLDYRPSKTQRSNLELLRYLSFCGIGGTLAMVDGEWDSYKTWANEQADMPADEFPAAMERQKDALRAKFAEITAEDLGREATLPTGTKVTLGRALLDVPLKWLTAYRMQLFTNVKAAGNEEIWTPDCWAGVSMPRDAQPAS